MLYLCHGFGDDASAWYRVGKTNFIADNLIAESKAKPCIIVMPLGHVEIPKAWGGTKELAEENFVQIEKELIEGIMPLIEEIPYRRHTRGQGNRRAFDGRRPGGSAWLVPSG